MIPYYGPIDGISIYHGDCAEIAPTLGRFDLVCTDPPYGIGEARSGNASRSALAKSRDYGDSSWDDIAPSKSLLDNLRSLCRWQCLFGGNYFEVPPSSCWLVWDKENGQNDFADCELAWTNYTCAVRLKRHRWHGMLRVGKEERHHPTQKPLAVSGNRARREVREGRDRPTPSGSARTMTSDQHVNDRDNGGSMSNDKRERRIGVRPFAEVITEMAQGDVEKELTQQLGELIRACDAHKKAGSMSIKLMVSPGPKSMQLAVEIKTTLPRKPIDAQMFYADEQGGLHLTNPNQVDMFAGPRSIIPIKPDGEN